MQGYVVLDAAGHDGLFGRFAVGERGTPGRSAGAGAGVGAGEEQSLTPFRQRGIRWMICYRLMVDCCFCGTMAGGTTEASGSSRQRPKLPT
jgi:hypothetical protein